jgi:iron complex transport system substrate-binding protein
VTEPRIGRRAALVGLLALAACSHPSPPGPVIERVVSLSPSTTEAVFAIGAGAVLVGRSSYCDYPPEALALPIVGGFADPSVEKIVALRPQLVIGARGPAGPALAQTLEARGIATFFPETESIPQIEAMILDLGKRLGHDAGAAAAVETIEVARRRVHADFAGKGRVRTIFLFDVGPIVVAGPGSFPDGLIREAGGDNIIKAGGAYPTLGLEQLLSLDPDVLLDGAADDHAPAGASRVTALRDAPGWRKLTAQRERRVRLVSGAAVLRPGPRIGEGLVAVARALHGDPVKAP